MYLPAYVRLKSFLTFKSIDEWGFVDYAFDKKNTLILSFIDYLSLDTCHHLM